MSRDANEFRREASLTLERRDGGKQASVEQLDVIDIIGLDKKTGHVILTISDHMDWSNSAEHQTILQAKFNKYLAFVESCEILTRYPTPKAGL